MAGIHFDVTSDNSNFVTVMQDTVRRVRETAETMKDIGKNFDVSSTVKQVESLKTVIGDNEAYIKKLKDDITGLSESINQAFSSGNFDLAQSLSVQASQKATEIQQVTAETEKYRNVLADVQGQSDATGESERNRSSIIVTLLGGQERYNQVLSQCPPALRNVITGLNGMTGAAKAFIATPLGAILAALITAYKAITTWLNRSAEGQQTMAKISGYLSGVLAGLRDIVISVGEKLFNAFSHPIDTIKKFGNTIKENIWNRIKGTGDLVSSLGRLISDVLTLKFDDAREEIKTLGESFLQLTTGIDNLPDKLTNAASAAADAANNIKNVAEETAKLNSRSHQLEIDKANWQPKEAELDKQIAAARIKMYAGSDEERNAAASTMQSLINKKYAKRIEFAKEEYEIRKGLNKLTTTSQEDLNEEQRLLANITELEAQRLSQQTRSFRTQHSASEAILNAKRAEEDELNALLVSNEEKRVALMEEGGKKERAVVEANYQKQMDAIRKQRLKWETESKKEGRGGKLTTEQESALSDAGVLTRQQRDKSIDDIGRKNRIAYLKEFGDFKQRQLAIEEEYDRQIENAADEHERQMLTIRKQNALASNGKDYFADFGTIDQKFDSLKESWLAKIETLPADLQEGAAKAMEDSLTVLINDYIDSGDDLDLSTWAASLMDKSAGALEKELNDLTMQAALNGDLASGNFSKLNAQIVKLRAELKKIKKESGKKLGFDDIISITNQAIDSFETLGESLGGVAGDFAKTAGSFLSGSVQIANAIKIIGASLSALEKSSAILAIISAAIKVISKIFEVINGNKAANEKAIQQAYDYAKALDAVNRAAEKMRFENSFGKNELAAYRNNVKLASQSLDAIEKKVIHIAGIESDGRSSWQKFWGASKNTTRLRQADYTDEDGKFNGEKLKAWYDTYGEALSASQKRLIDSLLTDWDNYVESVEESTSYLGDIFDDVSTNAAENMVDAFIATGDALSDLTELSNEFGRSMAVSAVKSMLMEKVFTKEAQKGIGDLIAGGKIDNAIDRYNGLLAQANAMSGDINAFLKGINLQELYEERGSVGAYETMSEQTGSALEGRGAAIQISNEQIASRAGLIEEHTRSLILSVEQGNEHLIELRDYHMREVEQLETIARQTRPLLEMREALERISNNTANL